MCSGGQVTDPPFERLDDGSLRLKDGRIVRRDELRVDEQGRVIGPDGEVLEDVPPEVSAAIVADVLSGQPDLLPAELGTIRAIDTLDGARLTMENGVILTIRPSGNAPELRCYVEAQNADIAVGVLADMMARLAKIVADCRK